jgi:hypothetical protein
MGSHPRLTAAFWEAITSCYRYFQNEPANLAFLLDAAAAMLTHGEMDCRRVNWLFGGCLGLDVQGLLV